MDVKDYSSKLDSAREKYREAQGDLKKSYDKNIADSKLSSDHKIAKQAENYSKEKTKLEEQNAVNNEIYSEKTKSAISESQNKFKEDIKKNTDKFAQDREEKKDNFDKKLTDISTSFKKSSEEKDKYHSEAKKTLGDRYDRASKNFEKSYTDQLNTIENRASKTIEEQKDFNNSRRKDLSENYQKNIENFRESNREEKFKELSRLKNDNQNLRTNFAEERKLSDEQKAIQIGDVVKNKKQESYESQKNFTNLQDDIRKKNLATQESFKTGSIDNAKKAEKKFSEDIKNIQRISNQKIQNGTEVDNLKETNAQMKRSYDNRIKALHENQAADNMNTSLKEEKMDLVAQESIKNLKQNNIEQKEKIEKNSIAYLNATRQNLRDKNTTMVDRYKMENADIKKQDEIKFNQQESNSKEQISKQRVEFGKVVNTLNEKNIDAISNIKNEYAKDKTDYIEKSKREFNDEKVLMKNDFNKAIEIRDSVLEKKVAAVEQEALKIIENYESRLEQLARKNEKEVETLKINEHERKLKEETANRNEQESLQKQSVAEIQNLRDKYERVIARDRSLNDQTINKVVQKYEDQLERERFNGHREMQAKMTESQASFERLYKSAEMEKDTMRKVYEERIEMMKLAQSERENSKKA